MKRISLFAILIAVTVQLTAQVPNDDRILLQGFYWDAQDNSNGWYNNINTLSSELGTAGFDMVWMPPPSNSGAPQGYLPRELNNLGNAYGTATEHAAMITALHNEGIEVIADIVINHRIGCGNWLDFCNPAWGTDVICSNDEVWNQPEHSNTFPRGNNDTGTAYGPARDIDHSNPYVQQEVISWMNNVLKGVGYDGWRYDFVHGYDEYYITHYNNNTNPSFSVGEYWTQDKQVIQNWIDETGSAAFDFPTYYSVKGAIKDNNWSYLAYQNAAPGGIGWDPRNYVTFLENHDTPYYDSDNNILNGNNIGSGYAYILTHPGVPTIFYPHYFDWGNNVKQEITSLMSARKTAGIHSESPLTIQSYSNQFYAATIQGDQSNLAVKLGNSNWDPNSAGLAGNWVMVASGNNYAVWLDQTQTPPPPANYDITVYAQSFTNAYAWDDNDNPLLGAWPGGSMTFMDGWYSITFSSPTECANIIFSNGGEDQTADLVTCGGYYYDGAFHTDPPPTGEVECNDGTASSITVYVQGYTHFYAWDSLGNEVTDPWPGDTLVDEGDGWFSGTMAVGCTNIIFSNNGADQTLDLHTCGGYYYDNEWHCEDPVNPPVGCVATDVYVDLAASGNNDGTSWADAYTDLQLALAALDGTCLAYVHMAEGMYYPTSGTSRGAAFEVPSNVQLWGGYPIGGGDRDATTYTTTLSGDIDQDNTLSGNSFHVVKLTDATDVVLDGLTIEDGNADNANTFGRARGGAIYSVGATLTLQDVRLTGNHAIYGGAMFATLSPEVNVNHCLLENNTALNGSALYHSNETMMYVRSSRIINNSASGRCAIEINNSLYTYIENSIIANNASQNANAIALIATNRDQTFDMIHTTVLGETKNKLLMTFQIGFNDQLDVNIDNSIIAHQNLAFSKNVKAFNNGILNFNHNNCYFQGSTVIGNGTNTLMSATVGDLLLNADYSVQDCSPIVDMGDDALSSGITEDITGAIRIFGTADLGAYEVQTSCSGGNRMSDESLTTDDFLTSDDISTYPNPIVDQLNIKTSLESVDVLIFDMMGRKLMHSQQTELNLSHLNGGMYHVQIWNEGEMVHSEKIIKH